MVDIVPKLDFEVMTHPGIMIQYFEPGGKSKNLETPWDLVLESDKKLTVRASAATTTRNWAR